MIGTLNEPITLLSPMRVPDMGGGFDIQYVVHDTIFARTETVNSAEDKSGFRSIGVIQRRFTMRHREDLIFEMRVAHRNKTYRITDIREEDDRRRFMQVTGEEVRP